MYFINIILYVYNDKKYNRKMVPAQFWIFSSKFYLKQLPPPPGELDCLFCDFARLQIQRKTTSSLAALPKPKFF